jgi:predicted Zn-dependent peptidase
MQIKRLERRIQPEFKLIDKINIVKAEKTKLDNQIPVYYINAGTQDLVKIDFIFNAGSWVQDKKLIASTTNAMLLESTKTFSAHQIAEKLDFFGSYLQNESNKHFGTLTIFILNKYLKEGLEIVSDVLMNPIFPKKELKTLLKNRLQNFIINNQKNDKVAREIFNEMIFGSEHPYGKKYYESDFTNISRNDIINFYEKYYNLNNCNIVISGKIDDNHFKELNNYFGKVKLINNNQAVDNIFEITPYLNKKIYEEKEGAFQTAIRIGKPTINMLHPDYNGLQIVNTIFGGYFGSRLMSNIREDKGYTYGIGSGLGTLLKSGYFVIVSEVKKEVKEDAINEIYLELDKMQYELVSEEELNVVRNYMMGEVLRGFDGAFSLSEVFKNLFEYNLDYDYFENLIHTIKNITREEIQRLSIKYLQKDTMFEVAVG